MSELRTQTKNLASNTDSIEAIPIVLNNNNFSKGHDSKNSLLSFSDGVTLFHELGHGHHGMMSNCFFKHLASTNVLKDFVELPSQVSLSNMIFRVICLLVTNVFVSHLLKLMEHWLSEPIVLKKQSIQGSRTLQ